MLFYVGKTGNEALKRKEWFSKPFNEYQLMSINGIYTKIHGNGKEKIHRIGLDQILRRSG